MQLLDRDDLYHPLNRWECIISSYNDFVFCYWLKHVWTLEMTSDLYEHRKLIFPCHTRFEKLCFINWVKHVLLKTKQAKSHFHSTIPKLSETLNKTRYHIDFGFTPVFSLTPVLPQFSSILLVLLVNSFWFYFARYLFYFSLDFSIYEPKGFTSVLI